MKLLEVNSIELPNDVDKECVKLCNVLNRLPGVYTWESCCGHLEHPYWIWFKCNNIGSLSRLGRSVNKNYSNGKWEIVVETNDTSPYGFFWLRTKEAFKTYEEMMDDIDNLIDSILYWFDDKFDEHFSK